MESIVSKLENDLRRCVQTLFSLGIDSEQMSIQRTNQEFHGHYTYAVFALSKQLHKDPTSCGEAIGKWLMYNSSILKSYQVIGGFINIIIKDSILIKQLHAVSCDGSYGHNKPNGKTIVVEYSSPNTNKPLHLGHLRNNFIGFAISSILKAIGYNVLQVCLVNDRGMHICKSMLAYQKVGNGDTPESTHMKGDHFVGKYYVEFDKIYKQQTDELGDSADVPILKEVQTMLKAWEDGDTSVRQLWKQMNDWVYNGFEQTYRKIGVKFDKIYYESQTYLLGKRVIDEGLNKGVFYSNDDSSVWVDLTDDDLDKKLLLRSDGTSVYITQDLGTADLRYHDFNPTKMIYVVGNEQDYHFRVLRSIMKKLDRPYADDLYHLSYGMVDLPCGKMKSREGTVVDADDIISEMILKAEVISNELGKVDKISQSNKNELYESIGLSALKFYLLRVDSKKRLMFDPQKSIDFQGDTGPFILYTYVRIQSILRKVDGAMFSDTYLYAYDNVNYSLDNTESKLIIDILEYPDKLQEAANNYEPSILAQYLLALVKSYNKFYEHNTIIKEQDTVKVGMRLYVSRCVRSIIEDILSMFGIRVVDYM